MKVLMLGWELPPHNSGGLGVACYQLCQELAKQDVDIEFVLPYSAEHDISFMRIHSTSHASPSQVLHGVYDSADFSQDERIALGYEAKVENLAATREFDVIHAHDWLTCRAALRAREVSGKPLVVHMHSVEADRAGGHNRGNPYVREIEGLALLLADHIIAVSEHTKRAIIREYDIPASKITVVYNSINPAAFNELDTNNSYRYLEYMKRHGYRVVVNVGRITVQKGLTNLLYAAKEVVARAPKTLFLLVGNGEQERELLELAAQLGIGRNVLFAGFQRGKRWRDAFVVGDLFVMPSISEPFGLTPLEAIGFGTPPLISKQSGVSEVMRNCLKVDYWDVNEMANQITAVVRHDGLRDTLLMKAKEEYASLSWKPSAQKVRNIYHARTELVAA